MAHDLPQHDGPAGTRHVLRLPYFVGGCVMLVPGFAGIVVPLLPATPFLLAAAWLFSRSSPRLETWLIEHPWFGGPLRDWQRGGAIRPRAKALAVASMVASYAIFLWSAAPTIIPMVLVAAVLLVCASFLLTRPNTPAVARWRRLGCGGQAGIEREQSRPETADTDPAIP